ncbi:MAG: hypothetical protein H3C59_08400 [Burkholderiaceae bacterium]|nr:hypothetical protein [Burkholderiaceae bacterium]MCD6671291.1 hypothetical protein [Burkholderiaceae bacterium]
MDIVWLALVGIALYFVADRILVVMERRAGHPFEQRSIIFFGLILAMALVVFALIRRFFEVG